MDGVKTGIEECRQAYWVTMHSVSSAVDGTGEPDLYTEPLLYPGTPLTRCGVLIGDAFREADENDTRAILQRLGAAALDERWPVIAVGSNASSAQLRRKLANDEGVELVIPITMVTASDLVAGVSAHVSAPGYVPATPVPIPGAASSFAVVWLDALQLATMDKTEPNYDRVSVCVERFGLRLQGGAEITRPCEIYLSRHGYLVHADGSPRRMTSQVQLIESLLGESPTLRCLAGDTAESFVAVMRRHAAARDAARRVFVSDGLGRAASTGQVGCPAVPR